MKRRDFITLLGGAATAPLWARGAAGAAQGDPPGRLPRRRVILTPQSENYRAFLAQMDELGFRAGRNVIVEYKALTDPRGPAGSVSDLLRSKPDVIVVTGPRDRAAGGARAGQDDAGRVPVHAVRSRWR